MSPNESFPSPSASNHADSGTAAVHEYALPLLEPVPQKKLAGHRLLVPTLDPAGQKKPYGHSTSVAGVAPLPTHTKPAVQGSHATAPEALYVPGGQRSGRVARLGQAYPAAQMPHSVILTRRNL